MQRSCVRFMVEWYIDKVERYYDEPQYKKS